MVLKERIPLPNGLALEVWDRSRPIAADTVKVELLARVPVKVKVSHFPDRKQYDRFVGAAGPEVRYEYRLERTFVAGNAATAVFAELLATFKKDALPYLSKPDFGQRLVRARSREIAGQPSRRPAGN